MHDILEGVPVERLMRVDPPTCASDCSVSRLVHDHIMRSDDQAFPVLDDGRLAGLVTLEDVRKVARDAWETTTVATIMTPTEKLIVVTAGEDAAEALDKLVRSDVRQLPVLRDDQLLGLLRRRDIIKWLQLQGQDVKR